MDNCRNSSVQRHPFNNAEGTLTICEIVKPSCEVATMSLSRGASQKSGGGLGSRKGSALSLKDMVAIFIVIVNMIVTAIMLNSYHYHRIVSIIMALNISLPSPQVLRRGSSRRDLFTTVRLSGWKLCSPQMSLQRLCFSVMTVTKPMLPMLMVFNRLPMAFASITQRH